MAKKKPRKAYMTPEAFRALYESFGLTQAETAKRLGLHVNTISSWVRGLAPITQASAALIREKLK